jgi:uncharacterized membrane protein
MELLETILNSFVNLAMLLFEYIGVGVITYAGIQGIVNYIRRSPDTRLVLAKGLSMGLEFKLGSEILRTVVVRNLQEIGIVAGIIALRATLTILIHWEIKNEENERRLSETKSVSAAQETCQEAASEVAKASVSEAAPEVGKENIEEKAETGSSEKVSEATQESAATTSAQPE